MSDAAVYEEHRLEFNRPYLYPKQFSAIFDERRYSIIEASTKAGKAQPLDSVVWTPAGPRRMGSLRIGEIVCTPTGVSTISAIYPQGLRAVCKVKFHDGTEVRCDAEHLWEIHNDRRNYRRGFNARLKATPSLKRRKDFKGWPRVLTTAELARYSMGRLKRMWVPEIEPVTFESGQPLPLAPYLIGVLIGDGGLTGGATRVSSADAEIVEAVRESLPHGHLLEKIPGDNVDWAITAKKNAARYREEGTHIRKTLRELGLLCGSHEKEIPGMYLRSSVQDRWSLLQGILDTDGSVDAHGQPLLEQTSPWLARDVIELVQSLGGSVYTRHKAISGYRDSEGNFVQGRSVYRQVIRLSDARECFRLSRKKKKAKKRRRRGYRGLSAIEFGGFAEMQCLELKDPRGLYLTDGFIPTHNTSGCIVWIIEQALAGRNGWNYWWVAPVNAQADIAFRRCLRALPRDMAHANITLKTITLPNGAVIWFKSGDKPDSLYGEDVYAAVVDEASRTKEDAWFALRTTLTATRGKIRIIGNVKGRRNWFYIMARKAEIGAPDMGYHKLIAADAIDAGVIDAAEVEDARRNLPERIFRELYLAEPSDDEGNPFGLTAIDKCIKPLSPSKPVGWGWDLAKSVNWTVGIALDTLGRTCRFHRFQKPWRETIDTIRRETARAKALVDSTGVGDPITEELQRNLGSNFEGYKFTGPSKQQLMEGLALAIQSGDVSFPDGPIVLELKQFEYEYSKTGVRYSAPEGFNDDCVCSLALAVMCKRGRADLETWKKAYR